MTPARPKLLDLYCGAGGAARGYQEAGFYVVGVDIEPQPNYCGDEFVQADAVEYVSTARVTTEYAAVHASPPCQRHSDLQRRTGREYPELIAPTRDALDETGLPYVIENVEGAPLVAPVRICGASIPGLRVIRHRLFEANFPLEGIACPDSHPLVFTHDKRKRHYGQLDQDTSFVQVTGGGNCAVENKLDAMGVEWMTGPEANEAIPPAYTRHIGAFLRAEVARREAGVKRCTGRCRRERPPVAFPRDASKRDGRGSRCRECVSADRRERRQDVSRERVVAALAANDPGRRRLRRHAAADLTPPPDPEAPARAARIVELADAALEARSGQLASWTDS